MELWIVEDGEKRGPQQSYEVRERIANGELTGEELAWHKDCDDWVPLRELDSFRSAFEPDHLVEEPPTPPPLPSDPRPILRFWARWFDVFLYLVVLFGAMWLSDRTGQNLVGAMTSFWFAVLHMLPFLLLEAIALHLWKTTPGKFLLGIRVQTVEGENLLLSAAVTRAVRVYILGLGLMLGIFTMISHLFGLWFTLKHGEAPWDLMSRNEVRVRGPSPWPVVAFVGLFTVLFVLLSLILVPVAMEMDPRLKELMEKS